jgi:ribonuclease HII
MICGFDEAGRGPLAGPVCAAAVVLPLDFPCEILNDSKKLNEKKREAARIAVYRSALAWGIGWASAAEIDTVNILKASLLAMKRSFHALLLYVPPGADAIGTDTAQLEGIADGLYVPDIPVPCRAMVRADAEVPEVMAASILAKTARDRMMERYSWFYPEYGYDRHKGYPTASHLEAIARYGPSPIQRMTFRVKKL